MNTRSDRVSPSPPISRVLARHRRRSRACLVVHAAVLAWLTVADGAWAAGRKAVSAAELTNLYLTPEYAQWLVGPIARMASDEEIHDYLKLRQDEAAVRFIAEFWQRREAKVRELYEQRTTEADKKYSESAYLGRRTDRGTIYILYGPPDEITYEEFRNVAEPDVELWKYKKGREQASLDGGRPERMYRFAKQGDLTSFYKPRRNDPRDRRRGAPYSRPRAEPPQRIP